MSSLASRHAYMIMVHKSLKQVLQLCKLLDDSRNDIYIHIDKKTIHRNIWQERIISEMKYSKVIFVPSISVQWGGASQIDAELNLLQSAVDDGWHVYYHLLSGSDLPLKSQNMIHSFFNNCGNLEFIHLGTSQYQNDIIPPRVKYWYPFQEYIGNGNTIIGKVLFYFQKIAIIVQRLLNIDINRHNVIKKYYGGANWFDITHKFALYVLKNKQWIDQTFRHGKNVDEVFIQTLFINSDFANHRYLGIQFDNDYKSILRDIDWERGQPYVWRSCDFEELIHSNMFFARKFDEQVDSDIIERICNVLSNEK